MESRRSARLVRRPSRVSVVSFEKRRSCVSVVERGGPRVQESDAAIPPGWSPPRILASELWKPLGKGGIDHFLCPFYGY